MNQLLIALYLMYAYARNIILLPFKAVFLVLVGPFMAGPFLIAWLCVLFISALCGQPWYITPGEAVKSFLWPSIIVPRSLQVKQSATASA